MASLSPSAAAPASGSSAYAAFSSSARTTVTLQQLSAFAMRNVATPGSCSGELMDLYFKLVVDGHVVYVSEIVRNTLNPVWMPFEPEVFAHEFDGTSTHNGTPLFCGTVFDIVIVRVRNYRMARRKSSALYGKIMADEAGTEDDDEDEDDIDDGEAVANEEKRPTTGFVFSGVNKMGGAFDFIEDDEDSDLEEKDVIPESECTTLVMSRAPSQRRKSATVYEEEILSIPFNIRELDPLPIGLTEISNLPLNTCLMEFNARLYVKREVIELLVEMGVIAAKHSRRKGSTIQLKEYSLHDGIDNLERIRTLKKHIEEVTVDTQSLQEQIKQRLVGAELNVVKDHKRGAVQDRIQALRRQIAEKRDTMDRLKAVMQDERRTFETDIHIPKALLNMMQMSMRYKDEKQGILERRCEVLRAAHKIRSRQAMLVKELGTVYPIEYVGGGEYSIRGIKISNSDLTVTGRADDEQLSTALGYIAHLVFMLSKYLHVNLRYKVMPYSSRSYIKDEINDPHGEYPLYRKGVERERFERAIFFLRKDVEQLLFARGLDPTQGNPLLGRLKTLTDAEVSWLAAEREVNPGATPQQQQQ